MSRIDLAMDKMIEKGGEQAIITKKENIYYLTGFKPSVSSFLILRDEPVLYVSAMDREEAELKSSVEVSVFKKIEEIRERLGDAPEGVIVEPSLPVGVFDKIRVGADLAVEDVVSELRMTKENGEIRKIKRAVEIAESALERLEIRESEASMAAWLDYTMRLEGSEGVSFDTIIASGVNSSIPHALPSREAVKSPILVDWGAVYSEYHSDTTRTFTETERQEEILEIANEALRVGIKNVKPGVRAGEVDDAVRSVIKEYGYGANFIHSTGHGVGLEVHEPPSLSSGDDTELMEGMVITIEPGIYLPGEFGVRVEDMVVVGKTTRRLNTIPHCVSL